MPLQPSPTTAPISRCTTVLRSCFDAPTLRMHPAPVKPVAESSAISRNHSNAFSHQTGKEKQKAALEHPPPTKKKNKTEKPHEAPMINDSAQRSENHLLPGQTNRYRSDPAPNQAGSFHLVGFSSLQQVLHHNQCQTSPAKQQREPRTILLSTAPDPICSVTSTLCERSHTVPMHTVREIRSADHTEGGNIALCRPVSQEYSIHKGGSPVFLRLGPILTHFGE